MFGVKIVEMKKEKGKLKQRKTDRQTDRRKNGTNEPNEEVKEEGKESADATGLHGKRGGQGSGGHGSRGTGSRSLWKSSMKIINSASVPRDPGPAFSIHVADSAVSLQKRGRNT